MNFMLNFSFYEMMKVSFLSDSMQNYFAGVVYLLFVFIMTFALLSLGMSVSQKWRFEVAKLTAFECGFDPLSSSRVPFSMRFFLVALLFLIFDMEMVLLFPYIFSLNVVFTSMFFYNKVFCFLFLIILIGGLVHEINEGSLEWKY